MRFILVMILTALLLTGCSAKTNPQPEPTPVVDSTPQGAYIPESTVETVTGGAVRTYTLPDGIQILGQTGGKLLLVGQGDAVELTVLTGDTLIYGGKLTVESGITLENARITHNGFAYYLPDSKEAVFLDAQLQEINRVRLPENVVGTPLFSADGSQVYYSYGQNVYAFDVALEISRLIRTHSGTEQTLTGCYFGGNILSCNVTDEYSGEKTVYFSAQTGESLSVDSNIQSLYSTSDTYLAVRMDGTVRQLISGTLEGDPQDLVIDQTVGVAPALELDGLVTYASAEETLKLNFYDLTLGAITSTVEITDIEAPRLFQADDVSGCLWFTAVNKESGIEALFRWDVAKTSVTEQASCFAPVYSKTSPDKKGLELCQDRVSDLNNQHGVTIRINEKAISNPTSYTLEPEYQTVAINGTLDKLDTVLTQFPKNFLYKSVQTRIRICIVRSITDGNGEQLASAHYWSGGNAYIVLTPQADVYQEVMKALGYIVDSRVLGNSSMYDYWDKLNPEGFVYGAAQQEDTYLEGEHRAFVDEMSMISAAEDRSRLFWQATQPNNAEMFRSVVMQQKLRYLCQAIRDAYGLEKKTDVYPWEQYLNESIAYKK